MYIVFINDPLIESYTLPLEPWVQSAVTCAMSRYTRTSPSVSAPIRAVSINIVTVYSSEKQMQSQVNKTVQIKKKTHRLCVTGLAC